MQKEESATKHHEENAQIQDSDGLVVNTKFQVLQ
jgi:hypothetical protein